MRKFLLTSILIHATFIFFLLNSCLSAKNTVYPIKKINVYLKEQKVSLDSRLHGNDNKRKNLHKNDSKKRDPRDNKNLIIKKKIHNSTTKDKNKKKQISLQKTSANQNQQKATEINLILHNFIQAEISYPKTLKPHNKKKVYLYFKLFPDGHIESTKILQSSGITLLDQEVLKVIARLSETKSAKNFLQKPVEFTVPIEFL